MPFKGLRSDLAVLLIDWRLPPDIIRTFINALEKDYKRKEAGDVPSNRKIGMNTNIVIEDPTDDSRDYVFFVRFARNDDDFWVSDVQCLGITKANKIFWKPYPIDN